MLRPQSLTARVLLVSTIWAVAALVVIGVVISTLYRQGSERGFQDLLRGPALQCHQLDRRQRQVGPGGQSAAWRSALFAAADGLVLDRRADRRIQHAAFDFHIARVRQTADRKRRRGSLRHPLRALLHHSRFLQQRGGSGGNGSGSGHSGAHGPVSGCGQSRRAGSRYRRFQPQSLSGAIDLRFRWPRHERAGHSLRAQTARPGTPVAGKRSVAAKASGWTANFRAKSSLWQAKSTR